MSQNNKEIKKYRMHCCNEHHKGVIVQLWSERMDVLCPICHKVMTFGRYNGNIDEGFIFESNLGNLTYIEHQFPFKLYHYIEIDKCGWCGKSNAHYHAKIHSDNEEPLFCNSQCAKYYYINFD